MRLCGLTGTVCAAIVTVKAVKGPTKPQEPVPGTKVLLFFSDCRNQCYTEFGGRKQNGPDRGVSLLK